MQAACYLQCKSALHACKIALQANTYPHQSSIAHSALQDRVPPFPTDDALRVMKAGEHPHTSYTLTAYPCFIPFASVPTSVRRSSPLQGVNSLLQGSTSIVEYITRGSHQARVPRQCVVAHSVAGSCCKLSALLNRSLSVWNYCLVRSEYIWVGV